MLNKNYPEWIVFLYILNMEKHMKKLLLIISALLLTQSALAAKQEYSCDDGKPCESICR